jgi:glycosyltransferase involved in cell wall biosynthesis
VTSALEPLPEISDGSGAAYVGRPDDPATLQHLLRLLGDEAFYAESSGRARALAEARYDVRQMTAAYRSLYADVLARRAAWQPSPDVVLP